MAYNKEFVAKWLDLFGAKIDAEKEYVSELDGAIGDHDHGFNMARGMAAFRDALSQMPAKDSGDYFTKLAMAMLSKVGGSSGPLYGSAFLAVGKVLKGKDEFTAADLANAIAEGLKAVESRGHSTEGEKTMNDVWGPVSRHLTEGSLTAAQVDAAVKATEPMKATKGRASYLGERSIGHIDPGAYSSGLFFKALVETNQ